MAAKACADFYFPTLKATAHIKEREMASVLEKARERAYSARVIPFDRKLI
jgi:hypothetical protein